MANIGWLIKRLQAMSIPEVSWRISQKLIQKKEEKSHRASPTAVTERLFYPQCADLQPDGDRLHLNLENKDFSLGRQVHLLGGYDYETYKNRWNAGFQTNNEWPDTFSYSLNYKQRDDIGDARTNWELNRHFQFALLAKDYFASGDKKYLAEFMDLFEDWNKKNPFLFGISWTSVMEVAIRVSNWCYAYTFLEKNKDVPVQFLEELRVGILNMTAYITQHYSHYSSANNHLIVEAYAIGQSGLFFDYEPWIKLATTILTHELPLQNYSDGVNKELSLHYQSFYMEAMGLMHRLLTKNDRQVPESWNPMLKKMCRYLANCMGAHGEVIEFGDNDEGKILDLQGKDGSHYEYVLGLLSCLLEERYVDLESDSISENLKWLFSEDERSASQAKPYYKPAGSISYKEGGNTILRSRDGRVLIGIDHAALGFGSIAAHGHADALSFQMFVDGQPIFVDPGTYIYHCDLPSRNYFRKTENHNTVCIDGKDQSEMLGAFLWGKKAECKLIKSELGGEVEVVEAEQNGYAPAIHQRAFVLSQNELTVSDNLRESCGKVEAMWLLGPGVTIECTGKNTIKFTNGSAFGTIQFNSVSDIRIEPYEKSMVYGSKVKAVKIRVPFTQPRLITTISWS